MSNYKGNVMKLDNFQHVQIPSVVFYDNSISAEGRMLYGVIFDTLKLSLKNGWYDDNLDVYCYCTLDRIMKILSIGEKKAMKLKKELRDKGLIIEKRQGLNKPNKIYVQKFEEIYSEKEILNILKDEQ